MNPYEAWLNGMDPMVIIQATAPALRACIETLRSAGTLDQPRAEGKWSARQILTHLADTEIVFAMRLRQAVAEDNHVIQPFDQDAWARDYSTADVDAAQAVFTAVRAWNIRFISAQPAGTEAKELRHPERGTMTFRTLVETMAGHDRNHLAQLT